MAITISGDSPNLTSATLTTPTLTNPTFTGTASGTVLVSGTSVASTSGTSIDFTSIPSWVKRITVMLNNVSTNGSTSLLLQIGAGSVTTTGYTSASTIQVSSTGTATSTSGFALRTVQLTSSSTSGIVTICLLGSNTWVSSHSLGEYTNALTVVGGGSVTLSGTLDRVRLTTTNGTDTFDAGTVNIQYE